MRYAAKRKDSSASAVCMASGTSEQRMPPARACGAAAGSGSAVSASVSNSSGGSHTRSGTAKSPEVRMCVSSAASTSARRADGSSTSSSLALEDADAFDRRRMTARRRLSPPSSLPRPATRRSTVTAPSTSRRPQPCSASSPCLSSSPRVCDAGGRVPARISAASSVLASCMKNAYSASRWFVEMLSTVTAAAPGGCASPSVHAALTASRSHALSASRRAICGTRKRRSSARKKAGTPMGTSSSQTAAPPT